MFGSSSDDLTDEGGYYHAATSDLYVVDESEYYVVATDRKGRDDVAYIVEQDGKHVVAEGYSSWGGAPDGDTLCYVVEQDGKHVVAEGYSSWGGAPDGDTLCYVVEQDGRYVVSEGYSGWGDAPDGERFGEFDAGLPPVLGVAVPPRSVTGI
jgi:hypothetical protein